MAYRQEGGRGRDGWMENNLYRPHNTRRLFNSPQRNYVYKTKSEPRTSPIYHSDKMTRDSYSYRHLFRLSSGHQSGISDIYTNACSIGDQAAEKMKAAQPIAGKGARLGQPQDGPIQLPVPKQYSPRRKISNLHDRGPCIPDDSSASGCRNNEEHIHHYADRENRSKSSVHIGGLLTLPKSKPYEGNKDSVHRSLSEVIAHGCQDIDHLVTSYNIKSAEVDLLGFSKTVQNFVRNSSNVIHVEPIMREMMLAFMHISCSWVALSSVLDIPREQARPLESIGALAQVFQPWQEKSKELLNAIREALHTVPEECEKYFTPMTHSATSEDKDDDKPRRKNGTIKRQAPRFRKSYQNILKKEMSTLDSDVDCQRDTKLKSSMKEPSCPYDADNTSLSETDISEPDPLEKIQSDSEKRELFDFKSHPTSCSFLKKIWDM